jgi:hypothetical protein
MNPYEAPQHNAKPNARGRDYSRIGLAIRIIVGVAVLLVLWFGHAYAVGRGYYRVDYGFLGYAAFESRFGRGSTFSVRQPNLLASIALTLVILCFVYSPLRLIRQLRNQARQRQDKAEQAAADCGA